MSATVVDLHAVFRAIPDAVAILDRDLTILEVSDVYVALVRSSRDALLGRTLPTVIELVPEVQAALDRALADSRTQVVVARYADSTRRITSAPVLEAGRVQHLIHRLEEVEGLPYGDFFETAPDAMVIVTQDGRILAANAQLERVFGYARDELIGLPLDVLIPERLRATHTDHLERYFRQPTTRPMGSQLLLAGRRRDGSELPIEVSLSPRYGARGTTVSASIRDVSDRHRLEQAERTLAERLRGAIDSIQDAIALFDADDRLVACNLGFVQLVNAASASAVIGRLYFELLDAWIPDIDLPAGTTREHYRAARLATRAQPRVTFDVRMHDGRSLRVTDLRTPDGGIVKTIADVTRGERRAAELREARAAAEAASAAKSEFLSSMSHELRTPLNAVLGFAQLLVRDRKEPLSDRHRERAEQIVRSGDHLLRLIDDVLDLAKIEAGRISMSPEPVGVREVLDEVLRTLQPLAQRQGIQLVPTPLPATLPMVLADRTRFAQILMNFGSNAIKYNRPRGTVRVEVAVIGADRVRVTVVDSGHGVPLDQQSKLFQPFQRAGQEFGPIEGTGIGLVITKRLADLMNGAVGFRSTPDTGSEFWVELPAHRPTLPVVAATPVRVRPAPAAARASKHRVLYVEDNPANVAFMLDLVETLEDVELVTAPTAELGLQLARAEPPTLVLMDINLPGMSGIDALRELRKHPETASIPVFALTAAASARDRQEGMEAGFQRYLTKPIRVDELVTAMQAVFDVT